jgi:hypothetical protein
MLGLYRVPKFHGEWVRPPADGVCMYVTLHTVRPLIILIRFQQPIFFLYTS